MDYRMSGQFEVGGTIYPNALLQPMFTAVGLFLSGSVANPPALIAILDVAEEVLAVRPASFTSSPVDVGIGSKVKGTAVFSASDLSDDVHYFALMDQDQNILAQALVSPAIAAGKAIIVNRLDTIQEAV